jgi:hypothetical protein
MRKAPVLTALFLAMLTSGCVLPGKSGKPAVVTPASPNPIASTAPAPASQPLSIPQTQVELPKPQPVPQEALAVDPAPTVELPVETTTGTRPGPGRNTTTRPGTQQRTDNTQPANPAANPPASPPPVVTPAEPPPPTIGEIIPQADLKRYQEQAQSKLREVQQIVDQFARRNRTPAQDELLTSIKSFVESSAGAEKRNDMKLADALAERALIKAKDLLNGR